MSKQEPFKFVSSPFPRLSKSMINIDMGESYKVIYDTEIWDTKDHMDDVNSKFFALLQNVDKPKDGEVFEMELDSFPQPYRKYGQVDPHDMELQMRKKFRRGKLAQSLFPDRKEIAKIITHNSSTLNVEYDQRLEIAHSTLKQLGATPDIQRVLLDSDPLKSILAAAAELNKHRSVGVDYAEAEAKVLASISSRLGVGFPMLEAVLKKERGLTKVYQPFDDAGFWYPPVGELRRSDDND